MQILITVLDKEEKEGTGWDRPSTAYKSSMHTPPCLEARHLSNCISSITIPVMLILLSIIFISQTSATHSFLCEGFTHLLNDLFASPVLPDSTNRLALTTLPCVVIFTPLCAICVGAPWKQGPCLSHLYARAQYPTHSRFQGKWLLKTMGPTSYWWQS